jgi:Tfp pilus assembly protein PilX
MTFTNRLREASRRFKGYASRQEGIALTTALILLVVLSALAFISVKWTVQDIPRTKNFTKTRQAAYIAEAGFHRAVNYFNYDATGKSPGELSNGFTDEIDGSNWPSGTFTNIAIGTGTYTATIVDNSDDGDQATDSDNAVILTSTGTVGTVSVSVEGILVRALYKADHALATDGDLLVSGNPTITGTSGSVHSNNDLDISGSPSVSSTATASGTFTATGSPTIGGGTASGASTEGIPVVNVSDYKSSSQYVLGADGIVRNGAGTILHDTSVSGNFRTSGSANKGWGYSAGPPVVWDLGDDLAFEGNYYVEGSAEISNSGSSADPFDVTIVAEGHITVGGNATLRNNKLGTDPEEIQNIFLMAGTDIDLQGNISNAVQGMIYAGEQIEISGNPTINGFILGADSAAADGEVTSNKVNGNPTITYNGDLVSPFLSNKVTVTSWQEL